MENAHDREGRQHESEFVNVYDLVLKPAFVHVAIAKLSAAGVCH